MFMLKTVVKDQNREIDLEATFHQNGPPTSLICSSEPLRVVIKSVNGHSRQLQVVSHLFKKVKTLEEQVVTLTDSNQKLEEMIKNLQERVRKQDENFHEILTVMRSHQVEFPQQVTEE